MSGEPCFAGTCVPVRALLDYIEGGATLDEFLEQYPTVTRAQAIGFPEAAGESLRARPSMRILPDECLPKALTRELPGHVVKIVPQVGWAGVGNGHLLGNIAVSGQFEIFLTADKRLPDQNKTSNLPFSIVLLRAQSNRMIHLLAFASEILRRLGEFKAGQVHVLNPPD